MTCLVFKQKAVAVLQGALPRLFAYKTSINLKVSLVFKQIIYFHFTIHHATMDVTFHAIRGNKGMELEAFLLKK